MQQRFRALNGRFVQFNGADSHLGDMRNNGAKLLDRDYRGICGDRQQETHCRVGRIEINQPIDRRQPEIHTFRELHRHILYMHLCVLRPRRQAHQLRNDHFICHQRTIAVRIEIQGARMHHRSAVSNCICSVDELGLFAGELAGIEQKEKPRQAAYQYEHAVDKRLTALAISVSEYRPASIDTGKLHGVRSAYCAPAASFAPP